MADQNEQGFEDLVADGGLPEAQAAVVPEDQIQALAALHCLHIAVPAVVANDVNEKVMAWINRLLKEREWIDNAPRAQHPDDERPWAAEMLRALHEVERLQERDRVASSAINRQIEVNQGLREALKFYQNEAEAVSRHMKAEMSDQGYSALLAVLTVLGLDGGERARAALGPEEKPKERRP